jgi:hypothetical protein
LGELNEHSMNFLNRNWRKLLLGALCLAFVGIVGAETMLRRFYSDELIIRAFPLIYAPDEHLGFKYIPGKEATICKPGICKSFRINSQGFYGPEFEQKKATGVYRIAVVGSSEATGIWLHGKNGFPNKLNNLFAEAEYPVEVINFSTDGKYRDLRSLKLIRDTVIHYEPDLVLVFTSIPLWGTNGMREGYHGYVINYSDESVGSRAACQEQIDRIEGAKILTRLYEWSYIVRGFGRVAINRTEEFPTLRTFITKTCSVPGSFKTWQVTERSSLEQIHVTRNYVEAMGGQLAIASYIPKEEHRAVAARLAIPHIELSVPHTLETRHEDDGHYNDVGHRMLADQLYVKLLESGLIPPARLGP